jgi:ribonuclease P protein component
MDPSKRYNISEWYLVKDIDLFIFVIMTDETFGKSYKLCSKKEITSLFEAKTSVKQFPFLLHFAEATLETEKRFQVVIAAPKRIFRKAHDRNRIKRLMREVFRKKKLILENHLEKTNKKLALFLIYTHKDEMPFEQLLEKMEQLLQKLTREIQ